MGKTKREDFYESIVYKKSKWAGRWDKRFFRLDANRLEYWEGDVAKGAPKGRYRVDANSKVSTKGDDLVVIAVQKELFELRVESEAVMNAWLDKIGRAISSASQTITACPTGRAHFYVCISFCSLFFRTYKVNRVWAYCNIDGIRERIVTMFCDRILYIYIYIYIN